MRPGVAKHSISIRPMGLKKREKVDNVRRTHKTLYLDICHRKEKLTKS